MQADSIFCYLPQLFAAFAATISSVSDGIQYGWASPVLPKLQAADSPVPITESDIVWLESIYMIGGVAGLPLTMYSVDKFGRKKSILLAALNNLAAWIIIAVATNIELLYVARFIAGVGADVAFVSVPMYLAEMADKKIRGFLAAFIYIMVLIGVVICYSLAPFVSIPISSAVGASFVLLQLATFSFLPETPYYHLLKGNAEKAEKALKWFRNRNDVEKEMEELKAAVARQSSERGRPQDLFLVKSNRKALLIMTVLNASQHMSSISVILMNLHSILADAEGIMDTNTAAIIFSVIMLVATIFAASIVDRFGRKILLTSSSLLSAVALGALASYFTYKYNGFDVSSFTWVPIGSVFLYAAAFRIGLGVVPIVITGELFPTSVKAMGMTLSDAMYVGFGLVSIYMYQFLSAAYGLHVPFFIFSGSCILTALFSAFVIPETKGKTLEQIQFILKGENEKGEKLRKNGVV